MDDAELRRRLWEGFAALQTLLGGSARERPRDRTRRARRVGRPERARLARAERRRRARSEQGAATHLEELEVTLRRRGRAPLGGLDRRRRARRHDRAPHARPGDRRPPRPAWAPRSRTSSIDLTTANAAPNADLRTVGRVNDLAYGNVDSRLERTLTTLEEGVAARLQGRPQRRARRGRARAAPRRGLRRVASWPPSRRRDGTASPPR